MVTCMQGLENTTMFCGDGINDLAALSAADVGMAMGATDAVIAAALSTSQGSVAGQQQPCHMHCNHVYIVICTAIMYTCLVLGVQQGVSHSDYLWLCRCGKLH